MEPYNIIQGDDVIQIEKRGDWFICRRKEEGDLCINLRDLRRPQLCAARQKQAVTRGGVVMDRYQHTLVWLLEQCET